MKYTVRQLSYAVISLVTVLGLAVVPASALRGSDHVSADTATTTNTAEDNTAETSDVTGTSNDTPTEARDLTLNHIREQARQQLETERADVKQKTEAVRQKACEQHQKNIDTRTGNFAAAAQRHLDVFNTIFTKVQAFHDSKKLNVTNYDTLVAGATAKQTAAQSAVDALKALNVQLDCTQPDPASAVAAIKQAVASARTALQAYRSSLKDLIVALKGASTAQSSSASDSSSSASTGGVQ